MKYFYIYKIYCRDPSITDCYVGSTDDLKKREYQHKKSSNNSDLKVYRFIREHGGWDNWILEVVFQNYIVDEITDLKLYYEYKYIHELNSTLNSKKPKKKSLIEIIARQVHESLRPVNQKKYLNFAQNESKRSNLKSFLKDKLKYMASEMNAQKIIKQKLEYKKYYKILYLLSDKQQEMIKSDIPNTEEIISIKLKKLKIQLQNEQRNRDLYELLKYDPETYFKLHPETLRNEPEQKSVKTIF